MSDTYSIVPQGDVIEWNHSKIKDYFTKCASHYDVFEECINEVSIALNDFVNDAEHRGAEAESAKDFVNERQLHAVQEAVYSLEHLHGMMMGGKASDEVSILDDFNLEVDGSESAVIKSNHLDKIISDYSDYNYDFRSVSDTIRAARDACQEIVSGVPFLTHTTLTQPDPETCKDTLEAFVSVGETEGYVQQFRTKFLDFIEKHKNDFAGSTFMDVCPQLLNNLRNIEAAFGDGSFDITRYADTWNNVKWTDIKDLLSDEAREKLSKYLDSFGKYLQGLVPKCQVIKYDPVNMNNGNYISSKVDFTVPGRFPIEFKRFYNAQSDKSGILGRGWSCIWDTRLYKDTDGDYVLTTYDGRELIFSRDNIGGQEVFLEIHGDEGILNKTESGFRITRDDSTYDEYDAAGYLVKRGDNNGENTFIEYTTTAENTALPIKITTKDGAFLLLRYSSDGILTQIEDHAGRICSYEYKYLEKDNETDSLLSCVKYPNGAARVYNYNEQGIIKSVISPEGVTALENEYDSKRRVVHQVFPDGGQMSYEYDDENRVTTATEQNGCKVMYISDELGRHIGTRYVGIRPGQMTMDGEEADKSKGYVIEEKFTYNEKNQKVTQTDKNGFTTRYTYDNRGHLTSIIGPEGLHETYTYDVDGHLSSKKDSEGNQYKYVYDFEGNLYSVTDPEGNRIRYDYEDGKVVSIRDAEGKRTNLTYDERGNVTSIKDPSGTTTYYECDELGRVIKTTDNEGNATLYTYDDSDNITSVTDPMGNTKRYSYNLAGLVTKEINPDGTEKTWEYNEIGRPSSFTDEDGRITRIYYNTMWKEEKTILPNGGEIIYSYDLLGNRVSVTDPEGRITRYAHDNAGNIVSEGCLDEDELIITREYTYDGKGRKKTETDGNGNVTTYKYDRNDNLISKTDANGAVSISEYDGLGRLIKTTDPLDRVTTYTYDNNGNLKTTKDAAGVITQNYYDNGRLIKVVQMTEADSDVEVTLNEYEYDSIGRLVLETQRDGFTVSFEYDKAGRVIKKTASNGRIIEYKYDSMGRVVELSDCKAVTNYTYTGTGKLKSITDALGNTTVYSYNELDLLCRIERLANENCEEKDEEVDVNLEGHVTIYEHDKSGKVISITDALGNKDCYTYDKMGNLLESTDRDGNKTNYTRDNNGNITGIKYSNGEEIRYSYDALNILKEVQDHLGITSIVSDMAGRTVSVTDYSGKSVSYEYGPMDEKTAIVYPDGRRVEYKYDAFGKLEQLSDVKNTEGTIHYYYDANARLIKKAFPNGTSTSYDYYQGGLLKSLISADKEGTLDKYLYSYDQKGHMISVNRQRRNLKGVSGIYAYSYDEIGRVSQVSRNGEEEYAYTYDAFGNRTSFIADGTRTIYSYDVLDRLISKTEAPFSDKEKRSHYKQYNKEEIVTTYNYDNRGNLILEYEDDILKKSYSFNVRGLIEKAVVNPDSDKALTVSYDYNYLGQRISKTSSAIDARYFIDITNDHNNLLFQMVNGKEISYTYDDNVVSVENNDESSYYQLDELGSTMYLTGTDGEAVYTYAYDIFGNRLNPQNGKRSDAKAKQTLRAGAPRKYSTKAGKLLLESLIQPFTFTGYREDEDGRYYAQARSYDSENARFTGEDKVRGFLDIPDSVNHYLYCYNAPAVFVDRNGLTPTMPGLSNTCLQPNGESSGITVTGASSNFAVSSVAPNGFKSDDALSCFA